MNEQNNTWLQKELTDLPAREEFIKTPTLILEENKPKVLIFSIEKPFETWKSQDGTIIKKIIPVVDNGEHKIWWLNPANPTYRQLLQILATGKTNITVLQTGNKKTTKYVLL